jgi:hypothetical protein
MEATAAGTTPRAHRSSDRLERLDRADFKGVVTIEAVPLSPVVWEQDDPRVAFPATCLAIAPIGNLPQIRTQLP